MLELNPLTRFQRFYARRSASFVHKKIFQVRTQRPLISFCFDDFPRSALFTGGAILHRAGLTGTYFASLGLMGQDSPTSRIFELEDLKTLFEQRHELGCHTFSHNDSWDTEPDQFEKSILRNQETLSRYYPGLKFQNFAYPISLPQPLTKKKTSPHFLSSRGGGQTFNHGATDLNQLSAYFLEKSRHNIQAIKDLIEENRQTRGWLVLVTHDVSDSPTPYGCTPEFFNQIVQCAVDSGAQILPIVKALQALGAPGCERIQPEPYALRSMAQPSQEATPAQPLVSILVPAYNAEEWISDTLRSATAQTWENKEIIVVDDGSTDRTLAIARRFQSAGVLVVTQANQGAAAARNTAYSLCHGDYIQWLDADDLLAPDKIAKQMVALERVATKNTLLSSEFGRFLYRPEKADFVPTALWENQTALEWLLHKLGDNLYMQTGTWLVSRALAEAAGPWDTRLLSDDDGEYFCRLLLVSDGVHFVPGARLYYRGPGVAFGGTLSYVGASERRIRAHWISMQLHIEYLLSLEDSPRVRRACLRYLQTCFPYFYPEVKDIVSEVEQKAKDLGGHVYPPHLSWKYYWLKVFLGWKLAKRGQARLLRLRWGLQKSIDKSLSRLENWQSTGFLGIPK